MRSYRVIGPDIESDSVIGPDIGPDIDPDPVIGPDIGPDPNNSRQLNQFYPRDVLGRIE